MDAVHTVLVLFVIPAVVATSASKRVAVAVVVHVSVGAVVPINIVIAVESRCNIKYKPNLKTYMSSVSPIQCFESAENVKNAVELLEQTFEIKVKSK